MENIKCDSWSDCCEKLMQNSGNLETTDFIYSYLYTCTFRMHSYLAIPILVCLILHEFLIGDFIGFSH